MEDTQQAGRDVVVGVGAWQAQLEANKRALVNDFVTRPSFFAQYPTGQTPAQYVDALNANTGGVLTAAERDALVGGLTAGTETRATALRKVAENAEFRRVEFNRAFVLMQYFGYLSARERRTTAASPTRTSTASTSGSPSSTSSAATTSRRRWSRRSSPRSSTGSGSVNKSAVARL